MTNWIINVYTMLLPLCLISLLCLKTSVSLPDLPEIPGVDPSKIKDVKRPSSVPRVGPKPSPASSAEPTDYYPMHAGRELFITGNGKHKLSVFCYHGEAKNLLTIFKTIELCLEIAGDDFQYYEGPNSTVVRQEHQESSWLAFYPWRPKTYKLELYKQSCIGIETSKPYKMILRARYYCLPF
ncbi:hypothetical protein Pmani_015558 [Petrolisthes manimaculis]|uniref:Uncharacterized protein n=1 Tax=Petrolisthes manimaculis TaxID=1843537 RepID=A0AAE1PQN1_9EUCA|nr:hypothetical protein Pmani_015558 [Petrolisthes manimaculis]